MTSLRACAVARCRDDSGQLTLLITGLTVVVLTLIIGALAVTSVQISRMRLLDAADSAALDATDDSAKLVYDRGLGTDLPLDDATVQASAADHLAGRSRPHGLESWKVASGTGSPDGRTAVVRLSGEADLPLIGGLLRTMGGSVTVTVESRARAGVTPG